MSFEKRKKLADLKADSNALFEHRLAVLLEKKKQVVSSIRDEAIYFLNEQGFSINKSVLVNSPLQVEADYKGSMKIKIVLSDPADSFMGADIILDVDYLKQKFEFTVDLFRQSFDTIWEDDLDKAILDYISQNEKISELNAADINGNYKITLIKSQNQKTEFENISDVLKFVLEM
ncbi:hypothetical protein BKG91_09470 [Rodentibacter caecimuris]|uniref:Uncharacterized protein n=1 Tax=Rodentibacter caecimuris TaxID=1796644 RepID=A0A9X8W0D2_9PAST|nr:MULTISPECIES: hypothetical protein [Pasteurellaceae]AOF54450.1 hypothetical protein AC062_2364 [Pasteurellaceae bacterium NI1060]MCQ9122754.1 kinase [Rodentibacter heylii]MCR1838522.1 kinase [Pasteurella caecimuris]MCU0107833.1 kinase [Pasteurella caecimuris]OOF72366.1 hypothetical protein BKG90_04550 [Rodentibacter heylii]